MGFGVWGSGLRVSGSGSGWGFQVPGSGIQVQGVDFQVSGVKLGTGFRASGPVFVQVFTVRVSGRYLRSLTERGAPPCITAWSIARSPNSHTYRVRGFGYQVHRFVFWVSGVCLSLVNRKTIIAGCLCVHCLSSLLFIAHHYCLCVYRLSIDKQKRHGLIHRSVSNLAHLPDQTAFIHSRSGFRISGIGYRVSGIRFID